MRRARLPLVGQGHADQDAVIAGNLKPVGAGQRQRRKAAEHGIGANQSPAAHEAQHPGLARRIDQGPRLDPLRGAVHDTQPLLGSGQRAEYEEDSGGGEKAAHRRGDRPEPSLQASPASGRAKLNECQQ